MCLSPPYPQGAYKDISVLPYKENSKNQWLFFKKNYLTVFPERGFLEINELYFRYRPVFGKRTMELDMI